LLKEKTQPRQHPFKKSTEEISTLDEEGKEKTLTVEEACELKNMYLNSCLSKSSN